jgi:hypothetical protein
MARDAVAATQAPSWAEIIGVSRRTTGLVLIAKVALVWPAATVTVAGTIAEADELPRLTTSPPARATAVRFTVPVRLPPPRIEDTDSPSDPTHGAGAGAGLTVSTVDTVLDADAEIVTLVDAETGEVEIEQGALVCPAATVIEADTLAAGLLLERLTCAPPAGAAAVSETVHDAPCPPVTEAGVTEIPARVIG